MKHRIFRLINGDDIDEYNNEYSLGEALVDLVTSNTSTHFVTHASMMGKTEVINIVVQ